MRCAGILPALVALVVGVGCGRDPGPPPGVRAVALGDAAPGRAVYETHCLHCHGEEGRGDGPGAGESNPPPSDFTNRKAMRRVDDRTLLLGIAEGGPPVGKSPLMTPWKGILTDTQMRDVAAYIRTLAAPDGE